MTGSYERVVATPLRRSSLLIGRALKELAPLVVQAMLITAVAIPFGFQLHPGHAAFGLLILGVFGVGVGAFSYSLGIATRKREWMFWGVQQSLIFPLLILSGMMLPIESGPEWMQVAARLNPLSFIVDAERALFANATFDGAVLKGVVVAVLTCAVGLIIGVRQIRRSTT
jgi:ABC-2 type transport system permease protein